MSPESMGRGLMILGGLMAAVGAALYFGGKFLPFGSLPGDFHWSSDKVSVHFPLGTSILISILLTVLANLFFRR